MEEDIEQDENRSLEDINREMYVMNEIMKRTILWNEKGGPQTPEEKRQRQLDDLFEEKMYDESEARRKRKRARKIETGYIEENPIMRKIGDALDAFEARLEEFAVKKTAC